MELTQYQKEALTLYEALLKKWSKALNLIAPSTMNHIWQRHFEDSMGILPYLPKTPARVVDLGSGAGFPALVTALMMPHLDITLLESDSRKCEFLKEVKRQLGLENVTVVNMRIEAFEPQQPFDIITARACASLKQLLLWSEKLRDQKSKAVFLKGAKVEIEISEALESYAFNYVSHAHEPQGVVLELDAIALKSQDQ